MRDVVVLGSTGSIGTQALEVIAAQPDRVPGRRPGRRRRPGRSCWPGRRWTPAPRWSAVSRATAVQDLQLALLRRGQPARLVDRATSGCPGSWPARTPPTQLAALPLRRRAQRHHRLGRAGADPGRAGGRHASWPWPTRSPWSSAARWSPRGRGTGPDRRRRLRALRPRPVPARRHGGRGRPAGAHRQRRAVPRPDPGARWPTSRPQQALAHPTWDMGRVITTNSATLVNKGLELLEAHLLYGVDLDRIDVVVHPQSMVHSMVQFVDGSTLAQCSPPDMKLPIALGLSWPDRLPGRGPAVRLDHGRQLDLRAAGRRGVPGGRAGPDGRPARRHRAGGLQRGQRGVRRRLPRRPDRLPAASSTSSRPVLDEHVRPEPVRPGADVGSTLVATPSSTLESVLAADRWARHRAQDLDRPA